MGGKVISDPRKSVELRRRRQIFLQVVEESGNYVVVPGLPLVSMNKRGCLRKKTEACLQRQDKRTKGLG